MIKFEYGFQWQWVWRHELSQVDAHPNQLTKNHRIQRNKQAIGIQQRSTGARESDKNPRQVIRWALAPA